MSSVILLLDDFVLFTLSLKSLKGFMGFKTRLERTSVQESLSELIDLDDQGLNINNKAFLEVSLLLMHLIADNISLSDQTSPSLVKSVLVFILIFVHDVSEVDL